MTLRPFAKIPVRRTDLEYPVVDAKLGFLGLDWIVDIPGNMLFPMISEKGMGVKLLVATSTQPAVFCRTEKARYLDAHIRSWIYPDSKGGLILRYQGGGGDAYLGGYLDPPEPTADFTMWKWVAGAWTRIAYEAVDLPARVWYDSVFSIAGSTLKSSRNGGATFPISATDTSITVDGYAGLRHADASHPSAFVPISIGAPMSPPPRVISYFEVPVIGSGTYEDPFRPRLPENITGGVNVLALTNSALIKSGNDGKPVEYRAIVRIFEQVDRGPNLAPIDRALNALRAVTGARALTREEAIKQAKLLDDKLHDLDLMSARELGKDVKQAAKEYKDWRVYNLGVKEELIEDAIIERYVEEDKGWG